MRLPPALSEPSPQDVLLAQGGDRAARDRVLRQRSRIRKRERDRERILAQQDGAQTGAAGAEQRDARDGAGAMLDVAAAKQGDDALPDDARGAGDAGDAGFEEDGGFGDGGFDDDDDDAVEQVCAQRECVRCAMALANDRTCAVCAEPSSWCSLQVPCLPLLVLSAPTKVCSLFCLPFRTHCSVLLRSL